MMDLPTPRNTSEGSNVAIWEVHYHILMEYLPVIVFTSIVCIVGIVGNVLTVVFYKPKLTRSSTTYLIAALAIVDIIVCVFGIVSVVDLCVNVLFSDRILCKAMYFLDQWIIYVSVLILWIISIDRYIKLCRPYGFQFNTQRAKRAIISICVFSCVVSVRDLITYDVIDVRIENQTNSTSFIHGHYCTSSTNKDLKKLIFYFHIFDVSIITLILMTFAFTYSSIGYKLFKHKKYMVTSSVRPFSMEQEESSITNSDVNIPSHLKSGVPSDRVLNANQEPTTCGGRRYGTVFTPTAHQNDAVKKVSVQSTVFVNGFVKSASQMKQSERNVTSMMFAVSIGLALCFAPFFLVSVTARVNRPGQIEIEPLVQLAVRSPFWNSVINPILFSVFNPKYRRYVKRSLFRCP